MTHLKWKLGAAGVIFAGAIVFLALAGMEKGFAYTLSADQFLSQSSQYQGKRIRICGIVGAEVRASATAAEFTILGKSRNVIVHYRGSVPDGLREGSEVIIEGKADPAGGFQADMLMTKCASKYGEQPMPQTHLPTGTANGGTQPGAAP